MNKADINGLDDPLCSNQQIETNEVIRFENGHHVLELPGPGHYYLSGSNTAEKIYVWYDDIHQVQSSSEEVIDVTTR